MSLTINGKSIFEDKDFKKLRYLKFVYVPQLEDIFTVRGMRVKNCVIRAFGNPNSLSLRIFRPKKPISFYSIPEVKVKMWENNAKLPQYVKDVLNRIHEKYVILKTEHKEVKISKKPKKPQLTPKIVAIKCYRKGRIVTLNECKFNCPYFDHYDSKGVYCE